MWRIIAPICEGAIEEVDVSFFADFCYVNTGRHDQGET